MKRWLRLRRSAWSAWNRRHRSTYAGDLSRVPSRDEIPELLNRRGLLGIAAEVGVKSGKYSDLLLTDWRGRQLISIDPWLEDDPGEYLDRANVRQERHERFYAETRNRLLRHGLRSDIWRLTSLEAAKRVEDGTLDFVYIDARHDYASVLEDLQAWFPKVRAGGLLAGHDYVDGNFASGAFGVRSAVDTFFGEREIRIFATNGRHPVEAFPSWLVEVPRSAPDSSSERNSTD
jgi:hypothetical protein